jgi:hypothetical protein
MTNGKNYFSVAVLPDNKPETLALFRRYAYAHVSDTRVAWNYDEERCTVETEFAFTTKNYEGSPTGTLFALYRTSGHTRPRACWIGNMNRSAGRCALAKGNRSAPRSTFRAYCRRSRWLPLPTNL